MRKVNFWHRLVCRIIVKIYFNRVIVVNPEQIPSNGPVIYVALHRNGAVDGFVYARIFKKSVPLISSQLTKNLFGKIFFTGIGIPRDSKEGSSKDLIDAFRKCRDLLKNNGQLLIFPEGTSSLGPGHLPFKPGIIKIITDCVKHDIKPKIIPVGIQYEAPCNFRRNVEVYIGKAISVEQNMTNSKVVDSNALQNDIWNALEEVAINTSSIQQHETVSRLAYASTLGTGYSYYRALKIFEREIPESIISKWGCLRNFVYLVFCLLYFL